MTRLAVAPLVALAAAGCGEVVDTGFPNNYASWCRIETYGAATGHGDTYRIIYANDEARSYTGTGQYPAGSVLVKEVYDLSETVEGPTPGDLQYLALMRRLDETPPGGTLYHGWLFTETDKAGGEETTYSLCFDRCHVSAPYYGAWFDYSRSAICTPRSPTAAR